MMPDLWERRLSNDELRGQLRIALAQRRWRNSAATLRARRLLAELQRRRAMVISDNPWRPGYAGPRHPALVAALDRQAARNSVRVKRAAFAILSAAGIDPRLVLR